MNQNGGIHKGGFAVLCHRNGGSESPGILSRTVSLDEIAEQSSEMPTDDREVLEAVLSLPPKYKDVVYLHYYEGYTAPQISRILGKNVSTIYTLINRSRQLLRDKLGGDGYE